MARPLRVLFVNRMASLERGGGETFDLEISRHLEQLGCEIGYLSGLPLFGGARTPIAHPRSYVLRTPFTGWFPWDRVRGGWRLRVWDYECFERAAARWILGHADSFDLVQACELPLLVSELKRRSYPRPVVMRVTAPNVYDPWQGMAKADAVIASGMSIARLRAGPRPDCVDVPNAVDVTRFKPQPSRFRDRHGIGPDEFVILYVARFQDFKNHGMLIEAFRLLAAQLPSGSGARLVLAGSGPLRGRVEAQVAASGLADRVLFLGEVSFDDLPSVYATADLMAITSDYESFCFAAIEAMACGLAVAATDCGWVPRLLGARVSGESCRGLGKRCLLYEGGVVTPTRDAALFAEAMCHLMRQSELRRQIGEFNRAKAVREHGWGSSAQRLLKVYASVLDDQGRAHFSPEATAGLLFSHERE